MFEQIQGIDFDSTSHVYKVGGEIYPSVTKILSSLEPEFDAEKISFFVARKKVREMVGWKKDDPEVDENLVMQAQQQVLKEWEDKRNGAAEHGTGIHSIMEDAVNLHVLPSEDTDPNGLVRRIIMEYADRYEEVQAEVRIFSQTFGIAGTTDLAGFRKTKTRILDIEDFKTNLHKGIQFDSISRKDGKVKHENRFFNEPVTHLELCNYNKYSLQLSIYAYLFEQWFGCQIGRLAIRWLSCSQQTDDNGIVFLESNYIPVPYMRNEAVNILIQYAQTRSTLNTNW